MTTSTEHNQASKTHDYLSVISLTSHASDKISREHDNMLSPVTSSNGSLSPASSISPRGNHGDDLSSKSTSQIMVRHNHVSTVMLHGVAIVCLFIDGKERLCLAQISNTLLKSYSYNEIHNRRVALGITCVQCTPVQLEILRRAGAMPISSRRCGMISKREAERLVKSFLEDSSPPKLPEDFAFNVYHECGWGGRGDFIPSRYNSSRAKCIKCSFCNMFFSPNKFIFHFHRTPESKYNHPDAANFNSWRRHLKLFADSESNVSHIWEDVKAMFNGGSRKRALSVNCSSSSSSSSTSHKTSSSSAPSNPKHMKFSEEAKGSSLGPIRPRAPPYPQYPVFPMPNKLMPFRPPQGHQTFCLQPPYAHLGKIIPGSDPRLMKAAVPGWGPAPDTMIPPYEMIWAKHLGLSPMENGMVLDPRMKSFESDPMREQTRVEVSPKSHDMRVESPPREDNCTGEKARLSAFHPVGNRTLVIQPQEDSEEFEDCRSMDNGSPLSRVGQDLDSEEHVDVDTIDTDDRDSEENNNVSAPKNTSQVDHDEGTLSSRISQDGYRTDSYSEHSTQVGRYSFTHASENSIEPGEIVRHDSFSDNHSGTESDGVALSMPNMHRVSCISTLNDNVTNAKKVSQDDVVSPMCDAEDSTRADNSTHTEDLQELSKEELQKELLTEMKTRRKLEADCKSIKETFQEQVEREKQFREEMAQQLHIVREKLCKELDQERQVRFSLQQKLQEAHETVESFSGRLKDFTKCAECIKYKEPLMHR